uniref:MARVEL domain-containing protein n=1 Tax=Panagrellus redivivus TaxID=6233 RepID=A0A7E4ZUW5_PANRE
MSTPVIPVAAPASSSGGKKKIKSKLHASGLLVAIRPSIQKGYRCGIIILIQALLAVFFATIGIIEIALEKRRISGIVCLHMASTFALLWIIHFWGWRYNSPKLLITHTVICALLALSLMLSVLSMLFSDLYHAVVMNLPPIRHQLQCGVIEAVVSVGLLTVFGAASWSRAEKGRAYSDARRRYMFAMKALESYILQRSHM